MTKKRFKHHMGLICEKRDGEYYSFTVKEVCDLLNALHEENEQLKQQNKEFIELIRHCYENWSEEKKKMVGEISNELLGDFE